MSGRDRQTREPCGTEAAARRHRRNGEKPCPACLEAETAAHRRRARQAREVSSR